MTSISTTAGPTTSSDTRKLSSTLDKVFFATGGLVCLLYFNCVLSLFEYYTEVYGNHANTRILFALNAGGFTPVPFFRKILRIIPLKTLVLLAPILMVSCTSLTVLFGQISDEQPWWTLALCCIAIFMIGVSGTLQQLCYTNLFFRHSNVEVSLFNSGLAISGILTAIVAFLQLLVFSGHSLFKQSLWYELFQLVSTIFIITISRLYFSRNTWITKNTGLGEDHGIETRESKPQFDKEVSTISTVQQSRPTFWETYKLIHSLSSSLFFLFTISMSVNPPISLIIGLPIDEKLSTQVLLITYHVANLLGNSSVSFIAIKNIYFNYLARCLSSSAQ